MKTLWVVGAGSEAVPGIERAKAMGLRVIASDGYAHAPGFRAADFGVVSSTYDADGTAVAAGVWKAKDDLHGVIAMCADVPITVARVAAALGLPGLPPTVAALGADKLAQKAYLSRKNIPLPKWSEVTSPKVLVRLLEAWGTDVVVKPVDSRGARGVTIMRSVVEAFDAFAIAQAASPSKRVMAEERLLGEQFSTEAILTVDGASMCFSLRRNYDRLDEFLPHVIEDGADGPYAKEDVNCVFLNAARALVGDVPCTVKGDMVLTPDGPKVIELALRLSGGYMSTELIPRMSGVDLVGAAIRIALGDPPTMAELMTQEHAPRSVAIRYEIEPGCKSHPERGGHYIGEGTTREEAIQDAERQRATAVV